MKANRRGWQQPRGIKFRGGFRPHLSPLAASTSVVPPATDHRAPISSRAMTQVWTDPTRPDPSAQPWLRGKGGILGRKRTQGTQKGRGRRGSGWRRVD